MRLISTHVDATVDAGAPFSRPPPPSTVIPPTLAAASRLAPLHILRRGLKIGRVQEQGQGRQRPHGGILHFVTPPRSVTSSRVCPSWRATPSAEQDCFSKSAPTHSTPPPRTTGCAAKSSWEDGARRKSRRCDSTDSQSGAGARARGSLSLISTVVLSPRRRPTKARREKSAPARDTQFTSPDPTD